MKHSNMQTCCCCCSNHCKYPHSCGLPKTSAPSKKQLQKPQAFQSPWVHGAFLPTRRRARTLPSQTCKNTSSISDNTSRMTAELLLISLCLPCLPSRTGDSGHPQIQPMAECAMFTPNPLAMFHNLKHQSCLFSWPSCSAGLCA